MMPINYDQHINDYLADRLSPEERADFEEALLNNKELKNHFDKRTKIIRGVKVAGKRELKKRLQTIHQEVTNETPIAKKRNIWPFLTAIAATIALLLVNFFILPNNSNSPQQLFADNYEAYQVSLVNRNNNANEDFAKINELYKQKEYGKALPLIKKELIKDPNHSRLLMAAGISQLELEQTESARSYFSDIINVNDLRLKDMANWYIALSYLKDEKSKSALEHLKRIKQDKQKEAKALIDKISPKS